MTILPNGVAVSGKTHYREWCATEGLVHDKGTADAIRSIVKSGDLCLDVGAHIGTLTKVMLDQGASVYAFEPNQDSFMCLLQNCPEARSFNIALGDKNGIASFFYDPENSGASHVHSTGKELVPVMCLDSLAFSKRLSFIKLDCEGFELAVLQGATRTILRDKPTMMIEMNHDALQRQGASRHLVYQLLDGLGYLYVLMQENCEVDDPQYDIIARPK
jgi:FkbM family methyltransferase